ncbi:MAG: tetratricopeptide repeat protein [Chloroflexota bacterium]|nr:tetratricopeptide repeat protein [Chloroflexota bacterium]
MKATSQTSPREVVLLLLAAYFTFVGGTLYGTLYFPVRVVSQVLLVAIIAGWLWGLWRERRPWPRTPLDAPLLAVLVVSGVSAALSIDRRLSVESLAQLILYVLLYYRLTDSLSHGWPVRSYLKAILMTGTAVCFFGFLEMASWYLGLPVFSDFEQGWWEIGGWQSPIPPPIYRLNYTLTNAGILAAYLELTISLALGVAFAVRSRWTQFNVALWLVAAAICLVLSRTRGGFLGLTGALVAFVALTGLKAVVRRLDRDKEGAPRPPVWLWIVGGMVGLLLVSAGLALGPDAWQELTRQTGTVGVRFNLWRYSGRMIADHPLLGQGPGTFGLAFLEYHDPFAGFSDFLATPHNTALHVTTDIGLIGLGAALWLGGAMVVTCWRAWNRVPSRDHPLLIGCIAALVSFLVHGMTDSFLGTPVIVLHVIAVASFISGWAVDTAPQVTERRRRLILGTVGLVGVALALGWMDTAQFFFARGVEAGNRGEWSVAATEMKRAAALDPGMALYDFQAGLAESHLAMEASGQLAPAIANYRRGLVRVPYHAASRANLAALLRATGDPAAAITELTLALEREPDNLYYHLNLGLACEDAGDRECALREYSQVLHGDLSLTSSGFWQGNEFRRREWPAILAATRARLDLVGQGQLAYFTGDLAEAEVAFRRAVERDPQSAEAATWLGRVLLEEKQVGAAEDILERAVELAPDDGRIYVQRARVFLEQGQVEQAEADLRRALFLGDARLAHRYLARIAMQRGDAPAAIAEYRRAFPASYTFTAYEVVVYDRRGIAANVVPQFRTIRPTGAVADLYREFLAVCRTAGELDQARLVYEYLLVYDPDFKAAVSSAP